MAYSDCPDCGKSLVKAQETEIRDDEPVYLFECSECGNTWTKDIL